MGSGLNLGKTRLEIRVLAEFGPGQPSCSKLLAAWHADGTVFAWIAKSQQGYGFKSPQVQKQIESETVPEEGYRLCSLRWTDLLGYGLHELFTSSIFLEYMNIQLRHDGDLKTKTWG